MTDDLHTFIDTHRAALHTRDDGALMIRPASLLASGELDFARANAPAIVDALQAPHETKPPDEVVITPAAVQALDNILDAEEASVGAVMRLAEADMERRQRQYRRDELATWDEGKVRRMAEAGKLTADDVHEWRSARSALLSRAAIMRHRSAGNTTYGAGKFADGPRTDQTREIRRRR